MMIADIGGLVLIGFGVLLTLVAATGIHRFNDVLSRMHATSKTQTLGLALALAGTALMIGTWASAGYMLLVLLAQMVTVPAASAMVGRAAFRRGFVSGSHYVVDDLSPRLAQTQDDDDDEDGFIDDYVSSEDQEELAGTAENRFPENVVPADAESDLSTIANWDEPEPETDGDDALDIDTETETEREAEESAGRD